MKVYLHDIPLYEAQSALENSLREIHHWDILAVEEIPLNDEVLGRVLAGPVWARVSSPHYHSAAMDGFALNSINSSDASPAQPVTLIYGDEAGVFYVDTGDPIPDWADAVVPIEDVESLDISGASAVDSRNPHSIRLRAALSPWNHVRPIGEDIVATELVLASGHILRPVDLGAIAAGGHGSVVVTRKPEVAIIPTGSELVPIGSHAKPGEIIEFNSMVLAAQIKGWGCQPKRMPTLPDDFKIIRDAVKTASETSDLILIIAGSSAGSEDYSAKVVDSLGDILVHGVAIRPGHPVILGMIHADEPSKNDVPIIGVPGFPVSAAMTGNIFVKPIIERWIGAGLPEPDSISAKLTRKVVSPAGDDDFMRVSVGRVGDQWLAAPLPRGSGVITSLVEADGITVIPRGFQGMPAGSIVDVNLIRPITQLEKTIFAIGSHDITLDLLAQHLAKRHRSLTSTNVGSLAGLMALSRGESHFAGTHLLDSESNTYNLTYIKDYIPGQELVLIGFVGREQGLLVPVGNPKSIKSLGDLIRPDLKFLNRQRGAGTRILLDYQLERLGIDVFSIDGYDREEYTHLALAASILSGRADCGLGIAAAATALGLDFVPLFQEEYDLVIPVDFYNSELLAPLLETLSDKDFQMKVRDLGGYDTFQMGVIKTEIG